PWVLFESGALSKTLAQTHVCTYLIGLEPIDIAPPLSMFQATRANKNDTKLLLRTINKSLDEGSLSDSQLDETVELWWPRFEEKLNEVLAAAKGPRTQRSERQMLEELITLSRSQATKLDEIGSPSSLPPEVRLAVRCGTYHVPLEVGSIDVNSRVA